MSSDEKNFDEVAAQVEKVMLQVVATMERMQDIVKSHDRDIKLLNTAVAALVKKEYSRGTD